MIEPDLIEPEAVATAPRRGRRRRAVVAGVTLLAVVAGGLAVAGGGDRPKAAPLALLAGTGSPSEAGTMAAPAMAPTGAAGTASGAPGATTADGRAVLPYPGGGWGLEFRVDGHLPDLGDHAAAWKVSGPGLDQGAVARIAGALGVTSAPVARDGGWFVDDGAWTLGAMPAGDTWSVSYYRSSPAPDVAVTNPAGSTTAGPNSAASNAGAPESDLAGARPASDAAAADPAGPALSRAEVEQRVRDLLARMGAPSTTWQAEVTETEIGPGWACAAPAPTPVGKAAPDTPNVAGPAAGGASGSGGAATPPCPPPPAPGKGFSVALFPVLDGHRAEWALWNVTLRSNGRIENLYGSWAAFDRAGDYKLRTVDAALKDLTSGPRLLPAVANGPIAEDVPAIAVAPTPPDATPAPSAGQSGVPGAAKATSGTGAAGGATTASGAVPAIAAVDCPPVAVPMAPETATSSFMPTCAPPAPQVVTITGVELGLMQAPAFEDGQVRLLLVPAYRFLGHFDNGSAWETSVIALHPDAIAPPPNVPIAVDGRESGGPGAVGKAVPPTPPDAPAG